MRPPGIKMALITSGSVPFRRMPGGLWRAMFKLQFFRATCPGPAPSWNSAARPTEPDPFGYTGGSAAQRATWEAVWRWHLGGAPSPAAHLLPPGSSAARIAKLTAVVRQSDREVERIGSGYALGAAASAGDVAAVAALIGMLMNGLPATRRAAMYGLASAGQPAVSALMAAVVEAAADPAKEHQAVAALLALGEASHAPTIETVAVMGSALSRWRDEMAAHVESARIPADVEDANRSIPHRSLLTSGGANKMSDPDLFATARQRSIAAAVQALAMLAERAAAAADRPAAAAIAELLLPLTLQPEPVEALPPGAVRPAQAACPSHDGHDGPSSHDGPSPPRACPPGAARCPLDAEPPTRPRSAQIG